MTESSTLNRRSRNAEKRGDKEHCGIFIPISKNKTIREQPVLRRRLRAF
jgi:hypothetical protein